MRAVVAWASDEGAASFLQAVEPLGRVEVILGVNLRGTSVEAMLRLLEGTDQLGIHYRHPQQTFHPKAYLVDEGKAGGPATLVVGSSNLTVGGLTGNIEASLVHTVQSGAATSDEPFAQFLEAWDHLSRAPYYHAVDSAADVERLYRGGYIVSEATRRREQSRHAVHRSPEDGPSLPVGALPGGTHIQAPPVQVPFPLVHEPPDHGDETGGAAPHPRRRRFYARTLASHDRRKITVEHASGTFEPDIGLAVRDEDPEFWGWPSHYQEVVRRRPRTEWEASARVFSSATPIDGLPIALMMWVYSRQGDYFDEHRIQPRPIDVVRSATPPDFDEYSLLVIETPPSTASEDYWVRLITPRDAEFHRYSTVLREGRTHRYGYGNVE